MGNSERIQATEEQLISFMHDMSDGLVGAAIAVSEVLLKGPSIDPESIGGGVMPLLELKDMNIKGKWLYWLYNDQCGSDVRCLLMLLRAVQLGFFPAIRLREIAGDPERKRRLVQAELDRLDDMVCKRLKGFQRREVTV